METRYCLRLIKETYIEANNLQEASQLAEMMAVRESNQKVFGGLVTIYTEVEEITTP